MKFHYPSLPVASFIESSSFIDKSTFKGFAVRESNNSIPLLNTILLNSKSKLLGRAFSVLANLPSLFLKKPLDIKEKLLFPFSSYVTFIDSRYLSELLILESRQSQLNLYKR